MEMDAQSFQTLLVMLTGSQVEQGEAMFNEFKARNPQLLVELLIQTCRSSPDVSVRTICSVLLKRQVADGSDHSVWHTITPETQNIVKAELLNIIFTESENYIRKRVADAIATLASRLMEENQWPELLPQLFRLVQSTNAGHREAALHIFGVLAFHVTPILEENLAAVHSIFQSCLDGATQPVAVRCTAVHAFVVLIQNVSAPAVSRSFEPLIGAFLQSVEAGVTTGGSDLAERVLEDFIELIDANAKFLRAHLTACATFFFRLLLKGRLNPDGTVKAATDDDDDDGDENIRRLAMEGMLSFSENLPKAMRKIPNLVNTLVNTCMEMLAHLEDDPEWNDQDSDEDAYDDVTVSAIGEEALDRLSLAFRGQVMLPAVLPLLVNFVSHADWRRRYAGLITIGQITEGCADEFGERRLAECLQMIERLGSDPHPRVRWAAVHCLAQICSDFSPEFQDSHHSMALPFLGRLLSDASPRVQAHSAAAIINFVSESTPENVQPYVPAILQSLWGMLTAPNTKLYIREQVLSSIAVLADAAKDHFVHYYDTVMPQLKQILVSATGVNDRKLRSRAIECVSLIAASVGIERFRPDSAEVCRIFFEIQQTATEPDDPQASFLVNAWSRLCRCMGTEFVPYLPRVVPPLLEIAARQSVVELTDVDPSDPKSSESGSGKKSGGRLMADDASGDAADADDNVQSFTISVKGCGDKRVSLHTSALEDKHNALLTLLSYMEQLETDFRPFLQPVIEVVVPLLKFPYMEEIRFTAASILPHIVRCAYRAALTPADLPPNAPNASSVPLLDPATVISSGARTLLDMPSFISLLHSMLETLFDAIEIEPAVEILSTMVAAVRECIVAAPGIPLDEERVKLITSCAMVIMQQNREERDTLRKEKEEEQHHRRSAAAAAAASNGEEDEEDEEVDQAAFLEDTMLQVVDLISDMIKQHRAEFMPLFFKELYPLFLNMIQGTDAGEQRIAMCVFDDLVEFGQVLGTEYFPQIMQWAFQFSLAEDASLRQAAVYGVGSAAVAAGADFLPFAEQALERMRQACQRPDARSNSDAQAATANAVSTIDKIVTLFPQFQPAVLPFWLSQLPVEGDELEARVVHGKLLQYLRNNHPVILGEQGANLPHVFRVLLGVVGTDLIDSAEQPVVVQMLLQLKGALDANAVAAAFAVLPKKQQNRVQKTLNAAAAAAAAQPQSPA